MPDLKPKNKVSVEAYLAALPEDRAAALERVRQGIHLAIPDLTETMAYGMPTFERDGTGPLLAMASQSAYLNLYTCDLDMASKFADSLKEAGLPKCGKSCVRFTVKKPIPDDLLEAILQFRK